MPNPRSARVLALLGPLLTACTSHTGVFATVDPSTSSTDTGQPASTDPTPTVTTPTEPTLPTDPAPFGWFVRVGAIDLATDFVGTESLQVLTAIVGGDLLCRVDTTLTAVAPRSDCTTCDWAYDLVRSAPTVATDVDGSCALSLGLDAAGLDALEGETLSYGYDPDYLGHHSILMVWDGTTWVSGSYVDVVDTTMTYTWDDGTVPVPTHP